MIVARTIGEARAAVTALPRPLGLVPTMGAFHDGHLSLVRAARERCASVVVSIFVNPTQFLPSEDLQDYPRDEARDLELAEREGADLVFAPSPGEMYPAGHATTVHVSGALTETLEGAVRPGHFDGVATIVTKLFAILAPDVAFFGEKDAQQLAVVRRLCGDLDLPVEIAAVATVREPDGLAMSSRNARLSPAEREKAADLQRALQAGRALADQGPHAVVDEVTTRLVLGFPPTLGIVAGGPEFSVDYVAVVDPGTFEPVETAAPDSLIAAAVRLGETRLIDNLPVGGYATDEPGPGPLGGPAADKEG